MADPRGAVGFALFGDDVTEDAPTLTAPVGVEVTVFLVNKHGQYAPTSDSHDFAIIPKLDDIPTLAATGGLADHVLWDAAIEKLFAGESGLVTFVPETPGNYYFLCTLPGHAAGGMIGEFVVTE